MPPLEMKIAEVEIAEISAESDLRGSDSDNKQQISADYDDVVASPTRVYAEGSLRLRFSTGKEDTET